MNVYRVQGKPFNNIYLAQLEAFNLNTRVEFDYYDHELDKINWGKEPEESFESLMDRRAHQLRLKYDKLIFSYSGGYDSHTMYNVFNRNKIKIDEIITNYSDVVEYVPRTSLDIAKKNWWDSSTKFTLLDREQQSGLQYIYNDPGWIYKDIGLFDKFMSPVPGRWFHDIYIQENYGHLNYGIICGLEKPSLVVVNGKWLARKLDKYFSPYMGMRGIESFYCSPDLPELDVKQCYMLRRAMLREMKGNISDGFNTAAWVDVKSSDFSTRYHIHALGCGRHGEVISGISVKQKTDGFNTNIIFDDYSLVDAIPTGEYAKNFYGRLVKRERTATNYLKGLIEIKSELSSCKDINKALNYSNGIKTVAGIWGKARSLGDVND